MGADDLASVRYSAVHWPRHEGPALTRDMAHTPHGYVRAARRQQAVLAGERSVSFVAGDMRATLHFSPQHLLDGVVVTIGQSATVIEYWDYRELGTVRFPMRMRETVAGAPVVDIEVKEVELR